MSICLPNLTLPFLTICEIITFKVEEKSFFAPAKGGQQSFGAQKKKPLLQVDLECASLDSCS
jgi:hypothetical protein